MEIRFRSRPAAFRPHADNPEIIRQVGALIDTWGIEAVFINIGRYLSDEAKAAQADNSPEDAAVLLKEARLAFNAAAGVRN